MSDRLRIVLGLIGVVALVATVASTSVVPSQAAWKDGVYVEQVIGSGTWTTTTTTVPTTTSSSTPTPEPSPGPIQPADDTTTVAVTWDPIADVQNCATVTVGTTSDQPAGWRYSIDFSGTPWHGSQPSVIYPNRIVSGPTNGVMIVGNVSGVTIQPGSTRTFTHCVYNGNPPPVVAPGPETYTYSATTFDWSTNPPFYACAVATVTGHFTAWGSPQFVGFSVPLDWAAALEQAVVDGLSEQAAETLLEIGLNGNFQINGDRATDVPNGHVYTLTGTSPYNNMGIKAGQVMTVRGCTS